MRSYLVVSLLSAALVAGAGGVWAQSESGPREVRHARGQHGDWMGGRDPARWVERMADRLDLDDAQRENMTNIVTAAQPELTALRERGRTTREAIRKLDPTAPDYAAALDNLAAESGRLATELVQLTGRLRADVSAELSDEQRAELASLMERRMARRSHRGPRGK